LVEGAAPYSGGGWGGVGGGVVEVTPYPPRGGGQACCRWKVSTAFSTHLSLSFQVPINLMGTFIPVTVSTITLWSASVMLLIVQVSGVFVVRVYVVMVRISLGWGCQLKPS